MKKQLDYSKIWLFIVIIALLLIVVSQCENNTTLEKTVLLEAKQNEKNAELFVKKNQYLQEQQKQLKEQLNNALKSKDKLDNKLQKVRTITKVIIDTTIANKYLKDRYKDNSIQVVNDLIQYDVCRYENKIMSSAIINRDSIIAITDSLYKSEVEVSENLSEALNQTLKSNKGLKQLLLNEQDNLKKQRRKNFILKVACFVLGGALIIK